MLCFFSSQGISTKENIKDDNVEKVDEVERRSLRNRNRGGSLGDTNANGHPERPCKDKTLEIEKSSKPITDEKGVNKSASMQHESIREKKKNFINLSEETKCIQFGEELSRHTTRTMSENNVQKQHATSRLKRARSPSMIFDCRDALNYKAKRLNENRDWNNREFKRPISKDEKQTRDNAYTSPKDILHRQRITRCDVEISQCNKFNMAREDVEQERASRIHHGREVVEQERTSRIYHGRQDVEQEFASRIHHERQDFEHERKSRIHHGRQDVEQERTNRIHHGRQDVELERANRTHHERQDIEQEHANRIHHGRQDVEKRERFKKHDLEMVKEVNERNNSRYEDSKRNCNGREMSLESRQIMCLRDLSPTSRRSSGQRDLEPDFKRFKSPRGLSPESRQMSTSRNILDQQKLEAYDKYNLRNYDHDMGTSPEKSRELGISRAQCIEDEPSGITYPKWYTVQSNIGSLGRIDSNCSTNLPVDLEIESFERKNLKFPILHGNYESHDFPMHSQTYGTNYSDITRSTYMDLHSPRLEMDYSNPQEMSFMRKNNYDILGVHNSSNDFNCFDMERKSHPNQRFGMNNLNSFDHITTNIGRDYGINNFPRSSLIGSNIPSFSKDMHEDSWNLSHNNSLLTPYRNHDINHSSTTKIQDYTTSWNNIIPSSPPSSYRHSTFENSHITSLESSWNQPSLYSLPSTNFMPFSQRELWP